MGGGIRLGDAISLSRIALSLGFLVFFRDVYSASLLIAIICAVMAQISDHLDGFFIRHYSSPSVAGWVFDSFADRAFYFAAAFAFQREYGMNEILLWMFVLREVCLYAVRVVVGDFQAILPMFRLLALVHAGVIRLAILAGCLIPFHVLPGVSDVWLLRTVTPLFAIATLQGYFNLYLLFRALQ